MTDRYPPHLGWSFFVAAPQAQHSQDSVVKMAEAVLDRWFMGRPARMTIEGITIKGSKGWIVQVKVKPTAQFPSQQEPQLPLTD